MSDTGTRGSSIGYWYLEAGQVHGASYSFFRYNPDGSLASFAKAANAITLSPDGSQFSVTTTINDYDANNNLLSTGCVTQTAKRLRTHPSGIGGKGIVHCPLGGSGQCSVYGYS